jgi:hypothetical protein
MSEQHEIIAISDHQRCFSKSVFEMTGIGCRCKVDVVETRVVGTNDYRNWQFPKGHVPFKVGDIVSLEDLQVARSTGVMQAYEEKKEKNKPKEPEKGA